MAPILHRYYERNVNVKTCTILLCSRIEICQYDHNLSLFMNSGTHEKEIVGAGSISTKKKLLVPALFPHIHNFFHFC